MNLRLVILTAFTSLGMLGTDASAQYISGYSQWRELSQEARSAYVVGLYDATRLTGGADYEEAIAEGLTSCARELSLNSSMMVEAIDSYYSANPQNWASPPVLAFHEQVVRGACLKYVNQARRDRGMTDWSGPDDTP